MTFLEHALAIQVWVTKKMLPKGHPLPFLAGTAQKKCTGEVMCCVEEKRQYRFVLNGALTMPFRLNP